MYSKILKSIFSKSNNININGNIYTIFKIFGKKIKLYDAKKSLNNIKVNNLALQSNIIQRSISTAILHQKVFPKYKNINYGKDVVLIATGPSLNNFIPLSNAIYVGVNKAFQYKKIKFDYLFLQDYSGMTKSYIEDFCNYNAKKFLGFNTDYISEALPTIIPEKYSFYPNVERYNVTYPTEKKNFTFDISTTAFGDSYSVVFPAMQFILWTNPKRIYLVGCDCNTNGYNNSNNKNNLAVTEVIAGWKRMQDFAKTYYPDTEIMSINPIGLKGIFQDIYQKDKCNVE